MIVPGGQVEIFTSESTGNHVVLTRKHKGFIRLALRHGATLVPVLSMGEWILLDNVKMSYMQGLARAYLGFPIPFVPYGSFICMPRRSPITIIIGEPLVFDRTKKPEKGAVSPPACKHGWTWCSHADMIPPSPRTSEEDTRLASSRLQESSFLWLQEGEW